MGKLIQNRKSTEIVNKNKFRTSLNRDESIENDSDSDEQQLELFLSKVNLINPGGGAVNKSKDGHRIPSN